MKNGLLHTEPFAIFLSAGEWYDVTFNGWQARGEHRTYKKWQIWSWPLKKPSYCIKTLWSLGLSTAVWDLTGSFWPASLNQGANKKENYTHYKKDTHFCPKAEFIIYIVYNIYVSEAIKTYQVLTYHTKEDIRHISDMCIMTILKLLPFQDKRTVLRIKAGYFKMIFGHLCSLQSSEVDRWSSLITLESQSSREYNRLLCKNKVKGQSHWRLCQLLNFHVSESIYLKSAQSPFIREKCVRLVSRLRLARWKLLS